MTLKTRIKKDMIYCLPWKIWKHEIKLLPISAQTLFAKRGIEIEKLEEELKLEGYIHQNDTLLEVLKNPRNLIATFSQKENCRESSDFGNFPDNWTEEDYRYNGF